MSDSDDWDTKTDGRKRSRRIRPVAPFTREPSEAADNAFDRETPHAVPRSALKSYRQLLAQYHLHPEAKFLNADYTDSGVTERRHVFAPSDMIRHIGKEANKWEQQLHTGTDEEAEIEYGSAPQSAVWFATTLAGIVAKSGAVEIARLLSVTERHLRRLINGQQAPTDEIAQRVRRIAS